MYLIIDYTLLYGNATKQNQQKQVDGTASYALEWTEDGALIGRCVY